MVHGVICFHRAVGRLRTLLQLEPLPISVILWVGTFRERKGGEVEKEESVSFLQDLLMHPEQLASSNVAFHSAGFHSARFLIRQ